MLSLYRFVPPLTGPTVARGLCILSALVFFVAVLRDRSAGPFGEALVAAQVIAAFVVYVNAARVARGTMRVLFAGLMASAAFAAAGHLTWAVLGVLERPLSYRVAETMGLAAQVCIFAGFAFALGRQRARVRFEVLVDAMLLVAAAAIVIVQLEGFFGGPRLSGGAASVAWSVLAEANLILLALLLAWRGDVLGRRVAVSLAAGTVALAIGNFLFTRIAPGSWTALNASAAILWTLATFFFVSAAQYVPRQDGVRTNEVPVYAADAGHIRILAIVAAILIAAGSIVRMGVRGEAQPELATVVGMFGVLLALRTGYALWTQQQTTVALERSVTAEREISSTLEQRVAQRTSELAGAQRVLQRMWSLGQQIAAELNPSRSLERFVEAAVDVVQADGGAVGLYRNGDVEIPVASGLLSALRGTTFAMPAHQTPEPLRAQSTWWTPDVRLGALREHGARLESITGKPVAGVVVVPIKRGGERIGAVLAVSRQPRRFNEHDIARLETMTDLLSVALSNSELVENLRQAEWRFRTLFRAAPDAVLTIFESGRIREANDAVKDVLGVFAMQAIGSSLEQHAVPDDRPRIARELARAFEGAPVRFEARFERDGAIHNVSLAARLLPEADPKTVLCVGRDVTAEREMRTKLAETERLAAVGELVAGVAHEVNNPLSTISAFAQLLLRDRELTDEHRDSLAVIQEETVRASQVVKDLLTFARRSETRRQSLDLNEIAERSLRMRSYELSTRRITVETELEPELPAVFGDARQLQQVVLNLVANATQAMAEQGRGTLRITTRREDDRVVLEVIDSGPGIPDGTRAHIFEPFFTTKTDGTGLGLSVSYGIVTALGGTISVSKTSPEGTTFRVVLRGSGQPVVRGVEESPVMFGDRSPLEGIRLLFVDDEPALRGSMVAFGKLRDFSVATASDGKEALDLALREEFDAVICDLRMPVMDGPALYQALSLERPTLATRTIFVTGDVVGATSRSFLDTTRQPVLVKPFDFERIEEALTGLLETEPLGS
ncbi:MAG TPA: ATP-binding protein [Gemmatimonadaceae bacterium]|nr:ATP-binding protein [Gemmatimonadaceae bacterium]